MDQSDLRKFLEDLAAWHASALAQAMVAMIRLRHYNALFEVHDALGQLPALETLRISDCDVLTRLPESLGQLSALHVSHCDALTRLPELLDQLSALHISHCDALTRLPESLGQLVVLHVHRCDALQEMPVLMGRMTALHTLQISNCGTLQHLPASFGEMEALRILDISHCSVLRDLPASLGQLQALTSLTIHNCGTLTRLPESFGQLVGLTALRITSNHVMQPLPTSCVRMCNLKKLKYCPSAVPFLPELILQAEDLAILEVCWCASYKDVYFRQKARLHSQRMCKRPKILMLVLVARHLGGPHLPDELWNYVDRSGILSDRITFDVNGVARYWTTGVCSARNY